MRRALDHAVYLAFRGAWALAKVTPLRLLRRVLEGVGHVAFRFDARHRAVVLDNLEIAYPEWSEHRRRAVARAAFANWGRIVAELAHVDAMADDETMAALRAVQVRVEDLTAHGKGLLVLTAHTANFELLARLWGKTGGTLAVFHRRFSNPFVDAFLRRERAASGVSSLDRGIGVREVLRTLARGEPVAAPLDQNQLPGRGIFVDMFGVPASTSTMLARLSLVSGAPVLPVFAAWRGGRLVPVLGEVVEPLPYREAATRDRDRLNAIRELTARYTHEIERAVRLNPDQWNWAHRRWKTRPPTVTGREGRPRSGGSRVLAR